MATVTRDDAYEFDDEKGFGWLLFAATMLGLAGVLSIFDGIAALSKASFYAANAHFVFSDLRTWGWIVLIVGVLLIIAAMGVFSGSGFARWFGIGVKPITSGSVLILDSEAKLPVELAMVTGMKPVP